MKYSRHVYNNFIWFWYDLHGTNPNWRYFQQNYRGVVFCAEIKVLEIGQNFLTIFFGTKETPEALWEGQKSHEASTRVEGAPYPLGALSGLVGSSWTPDLFPTPKILINIETPRNKPRSGVPPPQASLATKTNREPVPAPCRRGKPSPVAIFIIPAATMMRRE